MPYPERKWVQNFFSHPNCAQNSLDPTFFFARRELSHRWSLGDRGTFVLSRQEGAYASKSSIQAIAGCKEASVRVLAVALSGCMVCGAGRLHIYLPPHRFRQPCIVSKFPCFLFLHSHFPNTSLGYQTPIASISIFEILPNSSQCKCNHCVA